MLRSLLMAGAAAACASPALAQSTVSEVVVTAAPYPVSIDSMTSHVEILTRDELDLAPAVGLGDLLGSTPGVRSSAFGPGASRPIVRGLSGARVLVLANGVGMVDASTLSPDHAVASDPGEASRIEVLRGPSALAYGGSGVGGVVNVIDDRIPSRLPEGGANLRGAASYDTVDKGFALSSGLKAAKGPWVVAADVSVHDSHDYATPSTPVSPAYAAANGLTPDPRKTQDNTEVSLKAYGAGVSYVAGDGFLGVSVKRTTSLYGIPYAQVLEGPVGEPPVVIDLEQTRYDLRGEAPVHLGPFARVRVSAGWADYDHAEKDAATGEVGTRFLSQGGEARFELVQARDGGHDGAFGLQLLSRKLQAIGDEAFIPDVRIREIGAFTLQRWEAGRFGLDAGLRLDRRELETADRSRDFSNVSAALGASFKPADPWFLALSLSYNGRAPTELELFADGPHAGTGAFEIGDDSLSSEKVASAEATLRYARGGFRAEGHLFYASYDGFIEERRTGEIEDNLSVYRISQGDADFHGFELETVVPIAGGLRAEAEADYVRGSTDQGPPPRLPPWSATARLVYAADAYSVTGEVRHVAEQDRVAAFETPTPSYTLVNVRADWKPQALQGVRVFLDARNLTDETAREHASFLKDIVVQPGRSLRIGFSASY